MIKKNLISLILILMLAIFMRFYNFHSFNYFTGDEEIFQNLVKRVTVEQRPPLVIPNAQIGGSLGSFFIILVSPFFYLLNNNPVKLFYIGSFIGVMTTLAIYWVGNLSGGARMAKIASILYGGSFMVAIFDRRLWTLTLDPLMIVLSIGALIQIIQKKYKYFLLLAIATSFTWHSDPAIAVALLASILTLLLFRVTIFRKEFIPAGVYLLISAMPLAIFELRHPGTIINPLFTHLTNRSAASIPIIERLDSINLVSVLQNLSRSLFSAPSASVESYFCYCENYPNPLFSPLPEIIAVLVLVFCGIWVFKSKGNLGQNVKILIIFLTAFILGIIGYTLILSFSVYQHYFITVFPTFLLLVAFVLNLISKKFPKLTFCLLAIFITLNIWTLVNSSLRYPLIQKQELVTETLPLLDKDTFSVYGYKNHSLFDGGWVTLYTFENKTPSSSYLKDGWDFIYRTHSLYPYNPNEGEGNKIVIFHDVNDDLVSELKTAERSIEKITINNMSAVIIDNSDSWFDFKLIK